jgi:hypothetical protein
MKLIRNFRLRRIHAFVLGAIAAYCSMKIVDHISNVTSPTAFAFESYQNGTDAKARLLHLFPIGSNADVFFDFMKRSGGRIQNEVKISKTSGSYRSIEYMEPMSFNFITCILWDVTVDIDANRRITNYDIIRSSSGI